MHVNNGWETVFKTHPAEPGTVARNAWETLMLCFHFWVQLPCGWMSAINDICEEASWMVPLLDHGVCFNILILQREIFSRYSSQEISPPSLIGVLCVECQEPNFSC